MKRYLKLEIWPEHDYEVDIILDGLRTTIEREPIVTDDGASYTEILSDEELMMESFCLGAAYRNIEEEHGIEMPFTIEILELSESPVDTARTLH